MVVILLVEKEILLERAILKFGNFLERVVQGLVNFLYCLLVIITFIQVIARYSTASPFIWTEEVARYLFIWLCFLGATVVQKQKTHISLDILNRLIVGKVKIIFELVINLLSIFVFILLIISGIRFTSILGNMPFVTLKISMRYVYSVIPVTFSLMLVFTVLNLYDNFKKMK